MNAISEKAARTARTYGGDQPLGGYLAAIGTYTASVGALAAAVRIGRRRVPDRLGVGDVVLLTVATHKLSRLLAKDAVTSPLRAAGTRFVGPAGASELNEEVRGGSGIRHTVGEMVSCPFCLDTWLATALCGGMVLAPRLTRLVASCFTAIAGADFLQLAYDGMKKATGNDG